jgi:hypothetical protein
VELPADVLRLRVTSNDPRETETLETSERGPGRYRRGSDAARGRQSADDLRAIAERLGAPVVSHLQGRGILDSRHPLSIGHAEAFRMGVTLTSLWRSERVSTVRAGDGD